MQRTDEQTAFARRLRRKQTLAERILWILLRDRDLEGYKFRRQHPIGSYFADFVCPKHKLVIEIDGISHVGRERQDAARDDFLLESGFSVVRFTDEQVHSNPDRVASDILSVLVSSKIKQSECV